VLVGFQHSMFYCSVNTLIMNLLVSKKNCVLFDEVIDYWLLKKKYM
jgi:hypothetical protein